MAFQALQQPGAVPLPCRPPPPGAGVGRDATQPPAEPGRNQQADQARKARNDLGGQQSVGRAASVLANVPPTIAVERAILAELRGDAESTVAFASRARSSSCSR
jgi:hypothetical protein